MISPSEHKLKPMTAPPLKAVLKAAAQLSSWSLGSVLFSLPMAPLVVRALAKTATFMPIQPHSIDVSPPIKKQTAVSPPRIQHGPLLFFTMWFTISGLPQLPALPTNANTITPNMARNIYI